MANTAQDEIYRGFLEASQQQSGEMAAAGQSLASLILQADQMRQDLAQESAGASSKTRSSSATSSSGSNDGGGVLSDVLGVFKSGLGLSPLVQGIFSLFGGGGDSEAPPLLVKYALPPAIDFQAAEVGGQMVNTDYDQTGRARAYQPVQGNAASAGSTVAAPQITVNVSAMDARSFLDRSSDIAAAVREAMLNSNSINDVVSEL